MSCQKPYPSRNACHLAVDVASVAQVEASTTKLSPASEAGLQRAVEVADSDGWLADNAAALDSSNAYVKLHGLPLARFRCF